MNERAKITVSHLSRQAIVYLRQSSAAQVENNRESTDRQYALAAKAAKLGWPDDRIIVIDEEICAGGRQQWGSLPRPPRFHRATRRCGGGMAAPCARAAAGGAGDRLHQRALGGKHHVHHSDRGPPHDEATPEWDNSRLSAASINYLTQRHRQPLGGRRIHRERQIHHRPSCKATRRVAVQVSKKLYR